MDGHSLSEVCCANGALVNLLEGSESLNHSS